ncbi:MAG: type II toxin-antitoxin system HicB family antitoxin [Spiribacter salinus]|uniref:Type II toxin-antitoxin system HicB family antitoxin n=1 Tax=Spiribacter salinus TaxID=1335746 RepID=A0A540VN92_9GAMM|nr:MAG: type II toxin-antitoxin system HicB family antitoxin [Spiribacter salinus]
MNAQHYPVRIERDAAGRYLATCRDVPEALSDGAQRDEAKAEIADALMVALEGYRREGRTLPSPSCPEPGEILVRVKVG